ncbi:MAG: DnaB-like helicase N-terminal domain-containing protein, partial [Nanoarchaeota archaeon]
MLDNKPIQNIELEKTVLAGLLQFGNQIYPEICNFLNDNDFCALNAHKVIYSILKKRLESNLDISITLIAQEINSLNIKFKELDDVFAYLSEGLGLIQITTKGAVEAVKELKKITIARELSNTAKEIDKKVRSSLNLSAQEIIDIADEEYNSKISMYFIGTEIVNLFEGLTDIIEERG